MRTPATQTSPQGGTGPVVRCALYARKSTDDPVAGADKSVTRQVEQATKFATARGWTVAPDCIFVDDGASGAEFKNRPGLTRLMEALSSKQFTHLVMMESSRLGRDQVDTPLHRRTIREAGVRIFYYLTGDEEKCDSPEDQLIAQIKDYAFTKERLAARDRNRGAHLHRAEKGYATQAEPFGYDTVRKDDHSEYVIVPEEAAVVTSIFRQYAEGHGIIQIARSLNARGVPGPRGHGWWASTVLGALYRPLYRGVLKWGRTEKVDKAGRAGITVSRGVPRVEVQVPHLRLIPETLWTAVHARLATERGRYVRGRDGKLAGKPEGGRPSKYLLCGLTQCSVCGKGLMAMVKRQKYYACVTRHQKGASACTNDLRQRMAEMDQAVLRALSEALHPRALQTALEKAVAQVKHRLEEEPDHLRTLEKQCARLQKEITALNQALAEQSAPPQSTLRTIIDREQELNRLTEEIALVTTGPHQSEADLQQLTTLMAEDLSRLRDIIGHNPVLAKQILKKVLAGRLIATPTEEHGQQFYTLTGTWKFGGLLTIPAVATRLRTLQGSTIPPPSRGRESSSRAGRPTTRRYGWIMSAGGLPSSASSGTCGTR